MTLKTVPASIAALLAASVLLAGCGDDGSGDADADKSSEPTTSASSATSDDETDPGASSGSTDGDSGELTVANFNETTIGALEAAGSYRVRGTTTSAGATSTIESEATYENGKPLIHGKTTPGSPQQIETVAADGVVYIKADGLGIPAGKWLKIDPNDPANANNPLTALAATSDPEVALRAMGELKSLDLVGQEEIDGVDTDHYRAVMSTENYAEALGLPAEIASSLPATIPVDMWVDEDNRPIRYDIEMTVGGVDNKTSQTYYDFGADVTVTVPEDSDTVPLSESGLG